MKPTLSVSVAVIALLTVGGAALAELPRSVGEGEGEVNIVAWPGYIERGEDHRRGRIRSIFSKPIRSPWPRPFPRKGRQAGLTRP
jgi:hypothetical protein